MQGSLRCCPQVIPTRLDWLGTMNCHDHPIGSVVLLVLIGMKVGAAHLYKL